MHVCCILLFLLAEIIIIIMFCRITLQSILLGFKIFIESLRGSYSYVFCFSNVDEDVKAVDGSRVRLRLLDEVEINGVVLAKGSYMYATMSGFGQQRVKGTVKSLMVGDELLKVSLTLYDTDGMEGLYVPNSSFRETTKDIASGAMNSNMSINNGSYGNNFTQWGMQAIQNAYQQTTGAISKAIRKNKVKLKYGTFVYLVNSRENNKNK